MTLPHVVQDSAGVGPALQDPGLVPYIPAVAFLVLAALVWFLWRRLADD